MATKAWNVDIGGKTHYVELDHGTMSGKVTIMVDDVVTFERGMSMNFGDNIPFQIAGEEAELEISTEGMDWDYALKVANRVVAQL